MDALHEGLDLSSVGCKVILPASFTSSPQFMHKNLQDALALLRVFGGSNLFLTFTANPNWQEITDALLPGQTSHDRPDLIACIFHLKFRSLLRDIMDNSIFGDAAGYVYTVEYQKRGLPHCHLILFLERSSHISTPEAVDAIICTKFPDEKQQPLLFELVKKHMVHGPCSEGHSSPCTNEDGKCTKGFPKPFEPETEITGESYVKTKRRNTGKQYNIRHAMLDNRNIVSYSPYLLMKYQTHINVECTAGFLAIKYIYKVRKLSDYVPPPPH